MKKFISLFAVLAMCLAMFAGCAGEPAETTSPAASDLAAAREYLFTMYKDAPETTPADYNVVGAVTIGATAYEVEWTADHESVKFVKGENNQVTVDIDDQNPEEVSYKLTATIKDAEGNTESVSFAHRVPAAVIIGSGMSYEEIVEAAYSLEADIALPEEQTLYGVITAINDEFNPKYGNITVTIQIGELADKPIKCFRLSGEGAEELKVGDDITVKGILKNYKGKEIEFDKGCQLLGKGEIVDQAPIVEAAYTLEDGISMNEPVTLTGVISSIKDEFNPKYGNVTVIMVVDGMDDKPIMAFRLSGEGADTIKAGDTITVTGTLKNYKGTIEFDKGCTLDAVVVAE